MHAVDPAYIVQGEAGVEWVVPMCSVDGEDVGVTVGSRTEGKVEVVRRDFAGAVTVWHHHERKDKAL